jgi:hypothetical protein
MLVNKLCIALVTSIILIYWMVSPLWIWEWLHFFRPISALYYYYFLPKQKQVQLNVSIKGSSFKDCSDISHFNFDCLGKVIQKQTGPAVGANLYLNQPADKRTWNAKPHCENNDSFSEQKEQVQAHINYRSIKSSQNKKYKFWLLTSCTN